MTSAADLIDRLIYGTPDGDEPDPKGLARLMNADNPLMDAPPTRIIDHTGRIARVVPSPKESSMPFATDPGIEEQPEPPEAQLARQARRALLRRITVPGSTADELGALAHAYRDLVG